MNILKLVKKELYSQKLHFAVLATVTFLLLSYLRGKISSPGGFLAVSSIAFVVLFVAIFILTYTTTKKEFDHGTIYLLLQLPVSLEEVLVAKILSVLIEGLVLSLIGSLLVYGYFVSYKNIPSLSAGFVAKTTLIEMAVTYPVVTMFYFSFAVRIVARRFAGLLTLLSVLLILYVNHLLKPMFAIFKDIYILTATYSYENIYVNLQISLQDFLFFFISGLVSVIAGIWVIKKFNTL